MSSGSDKKTLPYSSKMRSDEKLPFLKKSVLIKASLPHLEKGDIVS
jgi:hypothetical protein